MTNSFFQTHMHPDHIHLTAVSTPFGLYEWLVMLEYVVLIMSYRAVLHHHGKLDIDQ
jgi:hypothetical protein